MGQINLAPFLVRYIKLIATAVFIIVVWSLVDRNVEPTPPDHTSRSLHPETPLVEVSTLPDEIPQDEIQYHETEFAPSPDVPHQWTEVNSTLGVCSPPVRPLLPVGCVQRETRNSQLTQA